MSLLGTVAKVGAAGLAGGEAGAVAGPWGAIAGTAGGILGSMLPEIIDAFRTAKTPEEAQEAVAPKLQAMVATLQAKGMTHDQALAKAHEAIQPELEAAAQGGEPMGMLPRAALTIGGMLGGAYAGKKLAASVLARAGGKGNAAVGGAHDGKSGASVATASESGTPLPNKPGASAEVGAPEAAPPIHGPFPDNGEFAEEQGINANAETRVGPAYSGKGRGPAGQSMAQDTENMPTGDEAMQATREVAQEPEERGFQMQPPAHPWEEIQAARGTPAPPPPLGGFSEERGVIPSPLHQIGQTPAMQIHPGSPDDAAVRGHAFDMAQDEATQLKLEQIRKMRELMNRTSRPPITAQFVGAGDAPPSF